MCCIDVVPRMMPYSLSWSLFCSLHSRSRWRTCWWGEQAFFSLSRLLWSTLRPGRLSSSRSRGTEDSCSEARDWNTASSHRVTSGIKWTGQEEWALKPFFDFYSTASYTVAQLWGAIWVTVSGPTQTGGAGERTNSPSGWWTSTLSTSWATPASR